MRQVAACVLTIVSATAASASALEPRDDATAYGYSCELPGATLGITYHARSFPTPRGGYVLPMALVFEVAVYPAAEKWVRFEQQHFWLEWDKSGGPNPPLEPSMLAAWLSNPDWFYSSRPRLEASAGTIGRDGRLDGVVLGGPPTAPRFPGDRGEPRPAPAPPGQPPRPQQSTGLDANPPKLVTLFALPSTESDTPFAGYVYFSYDGKLKKLRNLNLTIRQEEESCQLAIDPTRALLPTK